MPGLHYDDSDDFIVRRAFNNGLNDRQIAAEMYRRTGRVLKDEAVRKVRKRLGLRKRPTYERWVWAPEAWCRTA